MVAVGLWGRRAELLVWGRRSLPLLGSLLIHGVALASLSAWGGRSPVATDWQVETVELTPEELARVPDLDPQVEPPLPSGPVGGWQGLPVPSEGTQMPQGSRAADRWSLPSSLEDGQGDGGASERTGRELYERWLRQQERDRVQERADQRRLQAQRDRLREQERRRQQQAQQEQAQREQAQREQARRDREGQGQQGDQGDRGGPKPEGTQGETAQGTGGDSGPKPGATGESGTNPPPREVAGPLAQLPPVSSDPPAPGDRGQFSFDGARVGTDAAGLALGSLLADDAPWGQLYGEKPMRDGAGKAPEGMQGAWLLVDNDKPLEATYRTPVALCGLNPEPEIIRLAVLMGPDGQRATGNPPEAFQPQVVTSSGYRALDDYAIAQLDAALTAQQNGGKKRITAFDGYGVFVYAIRYAKSPELCGPQGGNGGGGDRGDALTP